MAKKYLKKKEKDVLIVGDLCNVDLALAEYLERLGLTCLVARPSVEKDESLKCVFPSAYNNIVFYENPIKFYRLCLSSRVVVNFTLGIFGSLRQLFFLKIYPLPAGY